MQNPDFLLYLQLENKTLFHNSGFCLLGEATG